MEAGLIYYILPANIFCFMIIFLVKYDNFVTLQAFFSEKTELFLSKIFYC